MTYVKDGKIRTITLDVLRCVSFLYTYLTHAHYFSSSLDQSHTGEYLAEQYTKCLKEFGISSRTLGTALDNASNNDAMLAHIPSNLPSDSVVGSTTQIRCFGHILNLAAKAFLSILMKPKKKTNEKCSDQENGSDNEDEDEENENEILSDCDSENEDDEDVVVIDERAQLSDREREEQAEIELLSAPLDEMTELSPDDLQVGYSMTGKVCHCYSYLFCILTSFFKASQTRNHIQISGDSTR
jgi:hypothetical protein